MNKNFLAFIIVLVILVLFGIMWIELSNNNTTSTEAINERFEFRRISNLTQKHLSNLYIVTDKDTGEEYLIYGAGGIVKLEKGNE